jgi:TonB-linked SusC/RagA family outer membrane protein
MKNNHSKLKTAMVLKTMGLWLLIMAFGYGISTAQVAAINPQTNLTKPRLVSVHFKKKPLPKALKAIAQKANAGISFKTVDVPKIPVTYQAEDESVYHVLDVVLEGTDLYYTLSDNKRVILIKQMLSKMVVQQETVSGTVTDAQTGDPLAGVNILIVGTSTGTSTNNKGHYSLQVKSLKDSLRFSYIGYKTQKMPINGRTSIDVELKSSTTALNQLVVSGVATKTKQSNVGTDVTQISAKDLTGSSSNTTVSGALSGKLPGVVINQTSNAPGGGFSVKLRGITSLGAGTSQPLFIIDGVFVNNSSLTSGRSNLNNAVTSAEDQSPNRLADINPDDIKNIQVLKGPAAAAIYGSRASAGVVIITTKSGSKGKTSVNISQKIGFQRPRHLFGYSLWSEQHIKDYYPANAVASELKKYRKAKSLGHIYNYPKLMYDHTRPVTTTNLEVSGGNQNTTYFISGGYNSEKGLIKNTGFKRISIRGNVSHKILERVTIKSGTNFTNSSTKPGFNGNQNGTGASVGYALSYTPAYAQLLPDSTGQYPSNPYFGGNPFQLVEYAQNVQDVYRFIQSFGLNADLWRQGGSALAFKLNGGLDYLNGDSHVYLPNRLQNEKQSPNPGDIIRTKEDNFNFNLRANLVAVNEVKNFEFTTELGFSKFHRYDNLQQIKGSGLPFGQSNIELASVQSIPNQRLIRVTSLGWYGQEQINWNSKIIGTAGIRFDRSSLDFQQHQYYSFPFANIAFNLSNFDFFNINQISNLKFRFAYGQTGGRPDFGVIYHQLNGVNLAGKSGLGISSRDINPNLKPETAQEIEFGTDIGLFNNRVSLDATYYIKTVKDLILDEPTASSTGVTAIAKNAARLRNEGIEIGLQSYIFQSKSFTWQNHFSFWTNRSKITRLRVPAFTTGGYGVGLGNFLIQKGFSPRTIVGPPAQPDSPSLYTVYGHADPNFQMSFVNHLHFPHNFELSFMLYWREGSYNINTWYEDYDEGGVTADWDEPDGRGDGLTKGQYRQSTPIPASSVNNSSYLKMKNITLKYSLPASVLGKIVKKVQFGITVNNAFVVTPYYGYGLTATYRGAQSINEGLVLNPTPATRQFIFSVNLKL